MTTYTAEECTEFAADLAAYKAALKAAMTGQSIVGVRDGENEVDFSKLDLPTLRAEIRALQAKVDNCNGRCRGSNIVHFTPTDC